MKKFYGTGVALVTPFNEKLEIDFKSLKRLLNYTSKGVDYYVVMGTTGEAVTIHDDEKREVLAFVKKNNPKKLPIVFGIGSNDTQHALECISKTDFNGVDAILSVSPYYNKPSQEGIYQHFKKIADQCPVPVILYNVPGRTGSNITAETTLRLAGHQNIVATKEASGSLEQCMNIVKHKPNDFLLLSGDDMLTVPLYSIGSKGVISVLANAFPSVFNKMKVFAFDNKFEKARREQFRILEINGPMYEEGNPVGVKYLLSKMGICDAYTRLPMASASERLRKKIDDIYDTLKRKG
ncbi:MAG TPA: 4-hydroxy-tetrahydrodipicolinate synthase [Cyclobacteriaceae bacterium]|nr:4-hydroxy-tetrahydrodipicolinate synthase [Cyclobacteriaceae bacterium]